MSCKAKVAKRGETAALAERRSSSLIEDTQA